MIDYVAKSESPNTVEANKVQINDYSTSYAYINNIACSERMYVRASIWHTYISDMEVYLGYKTDSSSTYTEKMIWNREGGDGDYIQVETWVVGEQDLHDWRIRVVDKAGGDTGYLDNFVIRVG